ncbi:hypothetical protein VDGD_03281 [Verticillium dahliae]|nr:hypothetical protein VDGD_03281 [Verticillium dahliae]
MSGYNYGPPPPPPQASQSGHAGYSHHGAQYQHSGPRNGGSPAGRGRAGYPAGGRPEYTPTPPHYEYGGHSQQQHYAPHAAGYPAPQPPPGNYPPQHQQWPQGHTPTPTQHQPHAPAPLSTANYHPNYAPQAYAHSQPPAHQPAYGGPPTAQQQQQYHYAAPPPYNAPQGWAGNDRSQPPYGGGHHRGGYGSDRNASRAPSSGDQARVEYPTPGMQPQVSGSYPQPYPGPDPRAHGAYPQAPQHQPQYHAYPPAPPPPSHVSTPRSGRDHYNKHDGNHSGRGRGGFRGGGGGGNMRGKGNHHGGDKNRPRHGGQRPDGPSHSQKQDSNASGKKKKRKTNTLGLTPGQDSESEDDEKEEETLRQLIGQDALQVSDIASYIADRRKNFPTAARSKAKKDAEVANNQHGDKRAAALERQEKMAQKLRKQLEMVESSIKRKREQQDEGDEMRDSPVLSDVGSGDDQPEVLSTRSQHLPAPPPPAKKADVSKHCKYYSTGGTCGKKGKCRFVHDPEVREAAMKEREANNGNLTIQQRLVLNDKDQEDLTVLRSIQYLREKGVISEQKNAEAAAANSQHSGAAEQRAPQSESTLPAAHSSLPRAPVRPKHGLPPHNPPPSALQIAKTGGKPQYKGWNLSGYGNSGLKSEDLP